jgi:nucleoside phosphorylase
MTSAHRRSGGGAHRVDFAILTVREDEFRAVLAHFPPYTTISGRRLYNLCRIDTAGGGTYEVAVVRCIEQGNGEAIDMARDILEDLSPSWLLAVGIAGGVPSSEITLGDVVVSSRIVDFSRETVKGGGEREYAVSGGPIAREAAIIVANLPALLPSMGGWSEASALGVARPPVQAREQDLYGSSSWQARVQASLERHSGSEPRPPRVTAGAIASSDRLIKDDGILEAWLDQVRNIAAVDMESAGVYRVATARAVPFLAIRGVSDLVGLRRDPDWTAYACHVAAAFTRAFLATGPIEPSRSPRAHPVAPSPRGAAPFHIEHLHLSAIRGFDEIGLSFGVPAGDEGQWVILLGANGVGKTTLLRALAIALSPEQVVQAVLGRLGRSAPMVRLGSQVATVDVRCPDGFVPRASLAAGETGDRLEARGGGEVGSPFLVAYGCRRGSALGGASREVDVSSPLASIEALFDEGASLVHAETWLKEKKLAGIQGGAGSRDATFFDAVVAALIRLLPGVGALHVNADAVEVEGPGVGRIPFGALSDGYLTTTGWILDMIARWAEDARRRNIVLDGTFAERMTGLAIVDELDLHLHPRWQRDVVSDLRRLFPRMSFVVTTHNPLTLLGLRPGEVYVLRRDEETSAVTVTQRDLPPGAGAERILTGEWFDLPSTLDDETLAMLETHRRMLRDGRGEEPEARALEKKLRSRLGTYADTSMERLAESAAAEVLDDEARGLTAEGRAAARAKIKDLLRPPKRAERSPRARSAKTRAS